MRRIWINAVLLALCLGATAFAQDVAYNFQPGTDFSKYKTYRWEQHPDSLKLDQLTTKQMGAAFDAELAKKGLQKVTGDNSDLVIVYQFATSQEKELTTFDSGYSYGPGWRGGWYGGGYGGGITTSTTSTIAIGSVALDMYDTKTKTLVWRGSASKTLDPKAKPDKKQKNMAKAAAKMLKNYPPKVKS
jgi:hypothetical protein